MDKLEKHPGTVLLIAALVVAASGALAMSLGGDALGEWKSYVEGLQAGATSLGIAAAGWWTYRLYVRQRLDNPRLSLDLKHEVVSLTEKYALVHAQLDVTNIGSVPFRTHRSEMRLRRVVPPPDIVIENAAVAKDAVVEGCEEITWPLVTPKRDIKKLFEVEPGETDSLRVDFVVDLSATRVVQFYGAIHSPESTGGCSSTDGLCWSIVRFLDLAQELGSDPLGADSDEQ